MTMQWVANAGIVALFILICLVAVILIGVLAVTVKFIADMGAEWRRESVEAATEPPAPPTSAGTVQPVRAVPPRDNVVPIMRSSDDE